MEDETTIEDKFSIPGDLKIEGKGSEVTIQVNLSPTLREGCKPVESPFETLCQALILGISFNFCQSAVG